MPTWAVRLAVSKPSSATKHCANLSSKLANSQRWSEIFDQMVSGCPAQLSNDSNSSDIKTSRQKRTTKLSSRLSPCKLPLQPMTVAASQTQSSSTTSQKNTIP